MGTAAARLPGGLGAGCASQLLRQISRLYHRCSCNRQVLEPLLLAAGEKYSDCTGILLEMRPENPSSVIFSDASLMPTAWMLHKSQ